VHKVISRLYSPLFLLLLLVPVSAFAQGVGTGRGGIDGYTITGKVALPDGKPAAGARVDATCDFTSVTASTRSDGTYTLTGVRAGNCSITARVAGYEAITESRTIDRDTPYGSTIYIPFFVRGSGSQAQNPLLIGIAKPAQEKFLAGLAEKKPDNALELFDAAIKLDPKFAAAYYEKGQILLQRNDLDGAIAALVKAIELKTDYVEAKYAFGRAHLQRKDYEIAEAVFRDLLTQGVDSAEFHLNLGVSLFYLKRPADAEKEFKNATTGKGGDKLALPHLYLGQIYASQKRNPEAVAELQKYLDMVPKAPNADHIKSVISDLKKAS
jgi:Tfp pilus assembly protein PilF